MINWVALNKDEQLNDLIELSGSGDNKAVLIFKHSTICSISSMMKNRMERHWNFSDKELPVYYLDLRSYREISNKIASLFNVEHQSPQIILINNGRCIYHTSHNDISPEKISDVVLNINN